MNDCLYTVTHKYLPSTVDEQFQTQFQKQASDEQKTKLLKPESDLPSLVSKQFEKLMVEEQKTKLKPVIDQMELIVDSTGGTLHLKDEDIKLEIQPGAIEEGKTVKISLENILEETDMPVFHPLESIISPIVKCGPEGTIFHKPCLLSFPHNAVNEEFWEFTLLFQKCSQDKWKKLTESNEKDINFTLKNGRCFINLIHFSGFAFMGRIRNVFHAKKSIKFGVFGKMIVNEYQLRVKFWMPEKQQEVDKEQAYQGEKLLEGGTVRSLYKDLEISVEIPNQEWRIVDKRKKIIPAEYLSFEISYEKFFLKRKNSSTNLLKAKLLLSQDSNFIPEVEVVCDIGTLVSSQSNVVPSRSNSVTVNPWQVRFNKLKHDLSLVYVGDKFLLLRCCLFDHIDLHHLTDPGSIAHYLFNKLHEKRYITPTNVSLLLDIAKVSDLNDVEILINQYVIDNKVPNTDEEKLSPYRSKLCEALKQFDQNTLNGVIAFYGLDSMRMQLPTIWDLVFHLERTGKLVEESERKIFAERLGTIANNILLTVLADE
ncbi:uncharacterized protein [Antedon mediterranea]|uniref:uncharacterized protein n=1 Tax=Antedon mediterranea TaxID=105859 RepID=UPI003AF83AC3